MLAYVLMLGAFITASLPYKSFVAENGLVIMTKRFTCLLISTIIMTHQFAFYRSIFSPNYVIFKYQHVLHVDIQ